MVIYNEIEFSPIPGYEGYYCSNCGQVLSIRWKGKCNIKYAKILKPTVSNSGYKYVTIQKNKKQKTKTVHRLLAMTFLEDYTEDLTVDHKDGDKLNNNLGNLKMATMDEQRRNKKNTTGVNKEKGRNYYFWRAYWSDETNKQVKKSFSVKIYGELFAYLLATELRQAMVEKYYNRP